MSAFSALRRTKDAAKSKTAPRTITVPTSAFATTWTERPSADVRMGVLLVSEDDVQTARSEAARVAYALHPDEAMGDERTDAFNDALMRHIVARGTCRPENVAEQFFLVSEDTVKIALTSEGARFIYQAIEALHIEQSPLAAEASDEALTALAASLANGSAWQDVPVTKARAVRRILAHAISLLSQAAT